MLRSWATRFLPFTVAMACLHCGAGDGPLGNDLAGDAEPTADSPSTPPPAGDDAAPPADARNPTDAPPRDASSDITTSDGADAGGSREADDATDAAPVAFDAASWMGAIGDATSLSALTIPGTHETCAHREVAPGTAQCQNLSLADQLNVGVRYVDIRCRHYSDTFEIHHDLVYQEMNFDDVLAASWSFLEGHPSETLLMSVREEYTPSGNTRTFEQTFDAYVQKNAAGWYLGTALPALSAARGKIVLVRRFGAASAKGINASQWADDTTFTIGGPPKLRVQDAYKVDDNAVKWTAISGLLGEAAQGDPATLYLNYTSGYKPLLFGVPNIGDVSDVINPKVSAFFSDASHPKGRYGVIAMDFIDAPRAALIFHENF